MNEEELQKSFGSRVRDCRKSKGLTQEALAALINKSVDTISNIERGFSATKIKTAAMIAEALGAELKTLFETDNTSSQIIHSPKMEISNATEEKLIQFVRKHGEGKLVILLDTIMEFDS